MFKAAAFCISAIKDNSPDPAVLLLKEISRV